jgi:hypothetical protein
MQWYARKENFYQERFNRELEFILNHNKNKMTQITYGIIDSLKWFYACFTLDSKNFILYYPTTYPQSSIIMEALDLNISIQNGIKYFKDTPFVEKFVTNSYCGCHICSFQKEELSEEESAEYKSNLEKVLKYDIHK